MKCQALLSWKKIRMSFVAIVIGALKVKNIDFFLRSLIYIKKRQCDQLTRMFSQISEFCDHL